MNRFHTHTHAHTLRLARDRTELFFLTPQLTPNRRDHSDTRYYGSEHSGELKAIFFWIWINRISRWKSKNRSSTVKLPKGKCLRITCKRLQKSEPDILLHGMFHLIIHGVCVCLSLRHLDGAQGLLVFKYASVAVIGFFFHASVNCKCFWNYSSYLEFIRAGSWVTMTMSPAFAPNVPHGYFSPAV